MAAHAASCKEAAPPPVVVLRAQLEVAEHHSDVSAGDQQDHKDQEEEAKDIVVLPHPDAAQYKEYLHKHSSKWQDAPYADCEQRLQKPRLVRDLAWDVAGHYWELHSRALIAEVCP
eukprot:2230-Heterococcus_DN1.PRE.2